MPAWLAHSDMASGMGSPEGGGVAGSGLGSSSTSPTPGSRAQWVLLVLVPGLTHAAASGPNWRRCQEGVPLMSRLAKCKGFPHHPPLEAGGTGPHPKHQGPGTGCPLEPGCAQAALRGFSIHSSRIVCSWGHSCWKWQRAWESQTLPTLLCLLGRHSRQLVCSGTHLYCPCCSHIPSRAAAPGPISPCWLFFLKQLSLSHLPQSSPSAGGSPAPPRASSE